MSSRARRVIAVGMLVLVIVASVVTFYGRENRVSQAGITVSPGSDISHPLR